MTGWSSPPLAGLAELLVPLLAEASVEAALLLAVAGLAAVALSRCPARSRHRLWAMALTGTLLAPMAAPWLPAWRVDWLPVPAVPERIEASRAAGSDMALSLAAEPALTTRAPVRASGQKAGSPDDHRGSAVGSPRALNGALDGATARRLADLEPVAAATAPNPTLGRALDALAAAIRPWTPAVARVALCLWLVVAAALVARLVAGLLRLRKLTGRARPLAGAWTLQLDAAASRLGVTRRVRLLASDEVAGPIAFGLRRPVVILPSAADAWDPERRRVVLLHELAHLARGDWPLRVVARLVAAIYWFHPLVRMGSRLLVREQERACDEAVIALGTRPSAYAHHLLEIARASGAPRPLPALEMARRSEMEGRLMSILDPHRAGQRRALAAAATVLVALAVPALAALRPAGDDAGLVSTRFTVGAESASPALATRQERRAADPAPEPSADEPAASPAPPNAAGDPSSTLPAEIEERLEPLRAEIEAVEGRLEPHHRQIEEIEAGLAPLHEEIAAVEERMAPFHASLEELGRELSQQMARLEVEMAPFHQRLAETEADLEPFHELEREVTEALAPLEAQMAEVQRQMMPIQAELERVSRGLAGNASEDAPELESLGSELEELRGRLAPFEERMNGIAGSMRPFHERLGELHERMAPVFERLRQTQEELAPAYRQLAEQGGLHQRMEEIHQQMEPLREELSAINERMRPHFDRLRQAHEEMRPLHEELGQIHERMRPLLEELHESQLQMHQRHEELREEMRGRHEELREQHREMREERRFEEDRLESEREERRRQRDQEGAPVD